jgi:hypothetical protein
MAYRKTRRSTETLAKMRAGRDATRMDKPAPDYPPDRPELRRRIVITDYDFGERVHTLDLYRTSRVDCYRVHVDGKPWKDRIGWSKILEGLRKSLPRVGAE